MSHHPTNVCAQLTKQECDTKMTIAEVQMRSLAQPIRRRRIRKVDQNPRSAIDHVIRENHLQYHPADRVWTRKEAETNTSNLQERLSPHDHDEHLVAGDEEKFIATEWRFCVAGTCMVSGQPVELLVHYAGCSFNPVTNSKPLPEWKHFNCEISKVHDAYASVSTTLAMAQGASEPLEDKPVLRRHLHNGALSFSGLWYPTIAGTYFVNIGIQGNTIKHGSSFDFTPIFHLIEGSPATIRVLPGPIAASASSVMPVPLEEFTSESLTGTVTALLKDRSGNSVVE
eukprot:Gregarina_sp_Poly_1__10263@NODE_718_length_6629_cov_150_601798_g540_i0_p3_GENE_NODE_718_length_6629_cov_150_601798_g540_i0NODE_718_length_6629_cov_150_601798_g540_i0_p3_ORF_typecomplete_len284_score22_68ATP12/PF07542_11/0_39_NODE_718_length_6629_cov_150_601798_g540_i048015652